MRIRALLSVMVVTVLVTGVGLASAQEGYRIEESVASWAISDVGVPDAYPNGVEYDPVSGLVFVAVNGHYGQHVQVFGSDGEPVTAFGGWGSGPGQFRRLNDVAVDSSGLVYVADDLNRRIQVFREVEGAGPPSFEYVRGFPCLYLPGTPASIYPYKLSFGPGGDLYVGGYWAQRAMKFSSAGDLLHVFGPYSSQGLPIAAAADSGGNAYVANLYYPSNGDLVYKYAPSGAPIDVWYLHGQGDGQVNTLLDILITPEDIVYIADQGGGRVVAFTTEGEFLGWYGRGTATTGWHEPGSGEIGVPGSAVGQLSSPRGLAYDPEGFLYVAELGTRRIQRFTLERTPAQLASAIQRTIDELLQDGAINGGLHTALSGKVTKALQRYESGKVKVALNVLKAFMNQVTDLTARGVLSSDDGQSLLGLAERLMEKMAA